MKIVRTLLLLATSFFAFTGSADARCDITASRAWAVGRKLPYSMEASSVGSECKRSVVLIVVRDGKGEVKYSFSGPARDNAIFSGLADTPVANTKNMRVALGEWLDAGLSSKKNKLSQYLEWKAGTEGPAETPPAEFPFTVNSEVSRETYEEWRKQSLPVFCFVQGIESMRCLVLTKDGTIGDVGVQSFPG